MVTKGEQVGLYLSGQPVQIPECNIYIEQPKIKEIVAFGEDDFLIGVSLLGHPERMKEQLIQGNSLLESYDDFQILLMLLREEQMFAETVLKFLQFICPSFIIELTDNAILFFILEDEKKRQVGQLYPFNYEAFKAILNDVFEVKLINKAEPDYNPVNEAAAAIAKKLKEGRDKINKLRNKDEGPQSLFGRYASILSIGMQMDINIFFNYTPFQLYDSFNRYFSKVSSDLYTKVSTTPLMDASKMETPDE